MMALGCRSGPTAHEIVWACTDPPAQKNRPAHHTPRQPRPIASAGHDALQQIGAAVTGADCCRLPRPLTSVGGLVPAHRRAQTQTLSASVGRPGQPFPPSRRLPARGHYIWQASPQAHPLPPAALAQRLANEGMDRRFESAGGSTTITQVSVRLASVFRCLRAGGSRPASLSLRPASASTPIREGSPDTGDWVAPAGYPHAHGDLRLAGYPAVGARWRRRTTSVG